MCATSRNAVRDAPIRVGTQKQKISAHGERKKNKLLSKLVHANVAIITPSIVFSFA